MSGGFTPDPFSVALDSGGPDDAGLILGGACVGYVAGAQPDLNLTFRPGPLPLYIVVDSAVDTTLVINLPDGTWLCADDNTVGAGNAFNPVAYIPSPQSGVYNIWVGNFTPGVQQRADLYITEDP